jgi:adenosylcobyric acid synthase
VIKDLEWLKQIGLFEQLQQTKTEIFGICGGYEMMFNRIIDSEHIEMEEDYIEGLGFIDDEIIFIKNKIVKSGEYNIFGKRFKGFEIHHGVSKNYPLYYENGNIRGTFVHNLFHNNTFQQYKRRTIDNFVYSMKQKLDIKRIIENVF